MKAEMNRQAEQYIRQNKNKRKVTKIVAILSVLVALLTTYILMLPGITMEYGMVCGLEEHQHAEACYTVGVVCGQEERETVTTETVSIICAVSPHEHNSDCFDSNNVRICGIATELFHTHNDFCYDGEGNRICTLPGNAKHVHSDSCYQMESQLTCQLEESAGHQHTKACKTQTAAAEPACGLAESVGHAHGDSCFAPDLSCSLAESAGHIHEESCHQIESTLVCAEAEAPAHSHEATCYNEQNELICGMEAGQGGHTHGETCYTQTTSLICGKEEGEGAHTHGDDCYTSKLVCTIAEGEGAHTHTESCYPMVETITCGMEAGQGAHFHGEACYTASEQLVCTILHQHDGECFEKDNEGRECVICGMDVVPEHIHSETCREVTTSTIEGHTHTDECNGDVLVCQLTEHTHEDACYPQEEVVVTATPEPSATPEVSSEPTVEPTATVEGSAEPTTEPASLQDDIAYLCGIPEHRHSADCLDETGALICGYTEDHLHGELCLVDLTDAVFYCGTEEHLHGFLCFGENNQLLCDVEEEHRHSYECLKDPAATTACYCGMEEHFHGELCYDENWALVCQAAEHFHSVDCYYACGKQEHVHSATAAGGVMMLSVEESDGCYDDNGNLICTLEEHTHSAACNTVGTVVQNTRNDQLMTLEETSYFGTFVKKVTIYDDQTLTYDNGQYATAINLEFQIPANVFSDSNQYHFDYDLPVAVTPTALNTPFLIKSKNGDTVGSFTIIQKGDGTYALSIGFDESMSITGTILEGDMYFGCSIDADQAESEDGFSIKFDNEIFLKVEEENIDRSAQYDISITKEAVGYQPDEGTLTYTLSIKTKGTPGEIVVQDNLFNISGTSVAREWIESIKLITNGTEQELQQKTDGTTEGYSVSINTYGNGSNMNITLPQVELSDTETEYLITYKAELNDIGYRNTELKADNNVTATSSKPGTPTSVKASSSANTSYKQEMLKKEGTPNAGDNTIEWRIVYNSSQRNIAGSTLADDMFALLESENDLTITPANGSGGTYRIEKDDAGKIVGISFGDEGDSDTNTYTITYKTKIQQSYVGTVSNSVKVTEPGKDSPSVYENASVNIQNDSEWVEKTLDEKAVVKNGDLLSLNWTVKIGVPASGLNSNIKVTDSVYDQNNSGLHYMTFEQLKNLYTSLADFLAKDSNGKPLMKVRQLNGYSDLNILDILNTPDTYSGSVFSWTEMELDATSVNNNHNAAGYFEFSYGTTADTKNISDKYNYWNAVNVGNKSTSVSYNYNPATTNPVIKYCPHCGKALDECRENDYHQGSVSWNVEVYQDKLYDQLTIEEQLPSELELVEYCFKDQNGQVQIKLTYNKQTGSLDITNPSNSGLNVEGSSYDATSGKLVIQVKEDDDPTTSSGQFGEGKTLQMTVSARLKDGELPAAGETERYKLKNSISVNVREKDTETEKFYDSDEHTYHLEVSTPELAVKLDLNGQSGQNNTTTTSQYNPDYFGWIVRVNQDREYDKLVITDHLPAGLTLTKIQVGSSTFPVTYSDTGDLVISFNNRSDSEKGLDISYQYQSGDLALTIARAAGDVGQNQNYTASYGSGKQMDIRYYFQIPQSELAKGQQLQYLNTADVQGYISEQPVTSNVNQTQIVNPKQPVVKKGPDQYGNFGAGNSTIVNQDGKLVWKVEINQFADYATITIEDELPEGVELDYDHEYGAIQLFEHGVYWLQVDENNPDGIKLITNAEWATIPDGNSFSYNAETGRISMTLDCAGWRTQNNNSIGANKTMTMVCYCKVKDEYMPDTEHGQYERELGDLTNTVSVTVNESDTLGSASQTQNLTVSQPVPDFEKITKGSPSIDDKNQTLHYQIDINPDQRDMNASQSSIKIIDTATYSRYENINGIQYERTLTLDFNSVKLYDAKYDENGTPIKDGDRLVIGKEVDATKWSMEYAEGEGNRIITLTVPDERALILVYDYQLAITTANTQASGADISLGISNSVKVEGYDQTSSSSTSDSDKWHVAFGGASLDSNTMLLIKHDAANPATVLEGVQFKVEQYIDSDQDGNYGWEELSVNSHPLSTDAEGKISVSLTNNSTDYRKKVLYRIVETQTLVGYTQPSNDSDQAAKVYYYWSSDQQMPIVPSGFDTSKAYNLSSTNRTVYIPNERLSTTQTVKKRWLSTDDSELSSTSHPWYTEVELRRYAIPVEEWEELIRSNDKINGGTVEGQETTTVTITVENTQASTHNKDILVTQAATVGSSLEFDVTTYMSNEIQISGASISMSESGGMRTYHCVVDEVTPDLRIYMKVINWNQDNISEQYHLVNLVAGTTVHVNTTLFDGLLSAYIDTDYSQTMKLTDNSDWRATWDNLPLEGMKNGVRVHYKYYVTENPPSGYKPIISGYSSDDGGMFVVENIKDGSRLEKTNLRVVKEWYDGSGEQYVYNPETQKWSIQIDGTTKTYQYVNGEWFEYFDDNNTIKVEDDQLKELPLSSVKVQLLQKDLLAGEDAPLNPYTYNQQETTTIDSATNWAYNFVDLPTARYNSAGVALEKYEYFIKEIDEDGHFAVEVVSTGKTYEDAETGRVYQVTKVKNSAIRNIDISVEKNWAEGSMPEGNPEVTVALSRLIYTDNGYVVDTSFGSQEKVLSAGDAWKYTWEGLPNGTAATGNESMKSYQYVVTETKVNGVPLESSQFEASYSYENGRVPANGTLIITNTKATPITQISAEKVWQDANGAITSAPANSYVTLKLMRREGEDGAEEFVQPVRLEANNNWRMTVTDLPKFVMENGVPTDTLYNYYFVEENVPEGYQVFYSNLNLENDRFTMPESGWVTVTNRATTALILNKQWKNADGTDFVPDNGTQVSFLVMQHSSASDGDVVYGSPITLDGVTDQYETAPWTITLNDLPQVGSNGETYTYYFVESNKPNGFDVSFSNQKEDGEFTAISSGTITATNTKHVELSVKKEWADGDASHSDIQFTLYQKKTPKNAVPDTSETATDVKVRFEILYYQESYNQYILLDSQEQTFKSDQSIVWKPTYRYDSETWYEGYYPSGSNNRITSSLDETFSYTETISSAWPHTYVFELGPVGTTDKTIRWITNNWFWGNGNSDTAIQDDWTHEFEVSNVLEKSEPVGTYILNAGNSWSYTFNENDLLLLEDDAYTYTYSVVEQVPDGYTVSYDGNGINSGIITMTNTKGNTPVVETVSLMVNKVWEDAAGNVITDKLPDGTQVTLKLMRRAGENGEPEAVEGHQEIVLSNNNWQATISGLPKYTTNADGVQTEYVYYFIEESVPEGYTVSYSNSMDGETFAAPENGEVTVTNTSTTIINAEKVWKDSDGGDLESHPDSVQLQLYQVAMDQEAWQQYVDGLQQGETPDTPTEPVIPEGHAGITFDFYHSTGSNSVFLGSITHPYKENEQVQVEIAYFGSETINSFQVFRKQKDEVLYAHFGAAVENAKSLVITLKPEDIVKSNITVETTGPESIDFSKWSITTVSSPDNASQRSSAGSFTPPTGVATPIGDSVILPNADGRWNHQWPEQVSKIGDTYYAYYVQETAVSGYTTTYDATYNEETGTYSFTVTNTKSEVEPTTIQLTVSKQWQNVDGTTLNTPSVETVQFKLYRKTESGTVEVVQENGTDKLYSLIAANGQWQTTIRGLPVTDAQGNSYTYYVVEEPVESFEAIYSKPTTLPVNGEAINAGEAENGSVTITNKELPTTVVTANKVWQNADGAQMNAPDGASVTLQLYQVAMTEDEWLQYVDGLQQSETPETPTEPDDPENPGDEENDSEIDDPVTLTLNLLGDGDEIFHTMSYQCNRGEALKLQITYVGTGSLYDLSINKGGAYTRHEDNVLTIEFTTDDTSDDKTFNVTARAQDNKPEHWSFSVSSAAYALQRSTAFTPPIDGATQIGAPITLPASDGNWNCQWPEQVSQIGDTYYAYYVEETPVAGYTATYDATYDAETGTYSFAITNTKETPPEPETISLTVKKEWFDADGTAMENKPNYTVHYEIWAVGDTEATRPNLSLPTTEDEWEAIHNDLPADKTYYVKETSVTAGNGEMNGLYNITYAVGDGDTDFITPEDATLSSNGTLTIRNTLKPTYVLPETGGIGTHLYTGAGALLTGAALTLLYRRNKRKRRANE